MEQEFQLFLVVMVFLVVQPDIMLVVVEAHQEVVYLQRLQEEKVVVEHQLQDQVWQEQQILVVVVEVH